MNWSKRSEKKAAVQTKICDRIEMSTTFGSGKIVDRQPHNGVDSSTKIVFPENGDIIIGNRGSYQKYHEKMGYVFDPYKEYVFYFVYKSPFACKCNFDVEYQDNEFGTRVATLVIGFKAKIVDAQLLLESGFLETAQSHRDAKFFSTAIFNKVKDDVTEEFARMIRKYGKAEIREHLSEYRTFLKSCINDAIEECGIKISDIQIKCENFDRCNKQDEDFALTVIKAIDRFEEKIDNFERESKAANDHVATELERAREDISCIGTGMDHVSEDISRVNDKLNGFEQWARNCVDKWMQSDIEKQQLLNEFKAELQTQVVSIEGKFLSDFSANNAKVLEHLEELAKAISNASTSAPIEDAEERRALIEEEIGKILDTGDDFAKKIDILLSMTPKQVHLAKLLVRQCIENYVRYVLGGEMSESFLVGKLNNAEKLKLFGASEQMSKDLAKYYTDANSYVHDSPTMEYNESNAIHLLNKAKNFITDNHIDRVEKDYTVLYKGLIKTLNKLIDEGKVREEDLVSPQGEYFFKNLSKIIKKIKKNGSVLPDVTLTNALLTEKLEDLKENKKCGAISALPGGEKPNGGKYKNGLIKSEKIIYTYDPKDCTDFPKMQVGTKVKFTPTEEKYVDKQNLEKTSYKAKDISIV